MNEFKFYAPIQKIDKKKRLVYGYATTEKVDQSEEIVDYEASKKAFDEWPGNIREMHQTKAVGTALEITPDEAKKGMFVVSRVSKGAEDTWQKVLDGTLKGYSIGGKIYKKVADTIKVGTETKAIERIVDYKLTELSLVDNPCNTECDVALVKSVDDSLEMTDVLGKDGEEVTDLEKKLKDFSQKWDDVQLLVTFEKLQNILRYVIEDIIYSDLSSEDKEKLLKKSLKQFQMKVEEMIPAASKLYSKLLDGEFYKDLLKKANIEGGEDTVSKEIKKVMDEATEELKKSEETKVEKKEEATVEKEKETKTEEKVADTAKDDEAVEKRFTALEKQIDELATLIKDTLTTKKTEETDTEKTDEIADLKKSVDAVSKQVSDFFGQPAERKTVVVEKEYTTDDETKSEEVTKADVDKAEAKAEMIEKLVAKRKAGETLTSDENYTLDKAFKEQIGAKLNKLKKV
jgi:hypothetical protein